MKKEDYKTVNSAFSRCLAHNITVYPVYILKTRKVGKNNILADNWYIEVNNNGKKKIIPKSVAVGSILKSNPNGKKQKKELAYWCIAIEKTLIHYSNKLKNGTN